MTRKASGAEANAIPAFCTTETLQRVGVAETDMMGIVHHANYVTYFERGRLEYMRRRGMSYKDMVGRGFHMPVVELAVRYRKPAFFDDLLSVQTRLGALSRVTVRFDYRISRPSAAASPATAASDLLVEGHVLLACVDKTNRPRPVPEDLAGLLFLAELPRNDELGAEVH